MPQARVQAIRSVDIAAANVAVVCGFYQNVWALRPVIETAKAHYFRGTGKFHHILGVHERQIPGLIRAVFDASDRKTVDTLYATVLAAGVGPVDEPRELNWPGGGYGFGCKDPEGRNLAVVCDVADHGGANADEPDRVRKISHINLNTGDHERSCRFFVEALGFRLIDETRALMFLNCNADHHSVVLHKGGGPTLNHIAFEMRDIDSMMRGVGRMRDNGYPIEWGVGRHGPGKNAFSYFAGPEEMPIEYTSEMDQVDGSYEFHGPDYWKWPPNRLDRWGVTDPPTARLKRIQQLFAFSADGYRLDQ